MTTFDALPASPVDIAERWPQGAVTSHGATMNEIVGALRSGRAIIVIDDAHTGEAALMFLAAHATTSLMAFMIRYTSGLVFVALDADRCDRLQIPPMPYVVQDSGARQHTVTVDAVDGTTTGISAHDRALTARTLADPSAHSGSFSRPGHVQPLRVPADVDRTGLASTGIRLALLADAPPAVVMCELVSERDPRLMTDEIEAREFGAHHNIETTSLTCLLTNAAVR
ncbi:hypothetical protein CH289_27185 [Rhodococcus sp. RS1C4]|nr:3,4-dihydroxy-2-butanone-4-phosphate synthase [Rhodococcus sp. RS1C4]OZC42679.1 hypothetical protein CH289_27185 [Rhodococcus sp. RS1C4]